MLFSGSCALLFDFLIVFLFIFKYSGHIRTSNGTVLYKMRITDRIVSLVLVL